MTGNTNFRVFAALCFDSIRKDLQPSKACQDHRLVAINVKYFNHTTFSEPVYTPSNMA